METFRDGLLEEKTELPERVTIACIGEKCAGKLQEIQLRNPLSGGTLVAEEFTTEGLVRCVINEKKRDGRGKTRKFPGKSRKRRAGCKDSDDFVKMRQSVP